MPINAIRKAVFNFFNPHIAAKELNEELKTHRRRIIKMKEQYSNLYEWNNQYVSTLDNLTQSMNALIWKKDANHKYLLANPLHCETFFNYHAPDDCLDFISGKSDLDLIKLTFTDIGVQNTFSNICISSDTMVAKSKDLVHFLEAGIIDGKEFLFYTIKTPLFFDNVFMGSIGIAWDMSYQSKFLIEQLNRWIYSKKVTKLVHTKDAFCYVVNPLLRKCKIFHHICPQPERGKQCPGDCSICSDEGNIFNTKGMSNDRLE